MKKYYDCPLEAAYMAKNFGIECVDDNGKLWSNDCLIYVMEDVFAGLFDEKIYIHPDSLHIFDNMEEDKRHALHVLGMWPKEDSNGDN